MAAIDLLKLATEACPAGAVVADSARRILLVNPAAERQFGYTSDELVGRCLDSLVPEAIASPGQVVDGRRKDGSTIRVRVSLNAVSTPDGSCVVAWIDEATEPPEPTGCDRREGQERLALERLVADLSVSFVSIDAAHVDEAIVDAQRRIVEAVGLDRSTLFHWEEGAGDFVRTHSWSAAGDGAPPLLASARRLFPWSFEKLSRGEQIVFSSLDEIADATDREVFRSLGTKSGVAVPLSVDGRIAGAIAFASLRETREWPDAVLGPLRRVAQVFANALLRKRVDAALQASEERFRTLADHAPVLIWVSGPDKRCVWFNRQWLDFTGQSMADQLGDGWVGGVHPDDVAACLSVYQHAFDARVPFAMQYRLRRHDEVWRWLLDHGAPHYAADGSFVGYLGSCIDITEEKESKANLEHALADLKQAHATLQQTQHVMAEQERSHVLGQMASGIAHEISNALGPVSLYIATIRKSEPSLSADAREYLQIMERSVRDVGQTLDRLRELSRRRTAPFAPEAIDANTLIDQVKAITRARWKDIPLRRGVAVDLQTEPAPAAAPIMADETELRGALVNLVFNAIDAMPNGGRVTLRTKIGAGRVQIEVSDTGIGMNEETRRRCLEPFFTTKGDRGTGLGLTMVHAAVMRHSAEIGIESVEGAGTTVRLGFPAVSHVAEPREPEQTTDLAALHLLVIDDDPLLLQSLADVLRREGHSVITAPSGRLGLAAFRAAMGTEAAFDVVLTDLAMPEADGDMVATEIKRLSASTPVILLTGWRPHLTPKDAPGVDCVLSKPPTLDELRAAFASWSKR